MLLQLWALLQLLLPGQVRRVAVAPAVLSRPPSALPRRRRLRCSSVGPARFPTALSFPPGSRAPSPVRRCSGRPRTERVRGHKMVFKRGERSAPCSRSPSATSVPLGRDSFSPGAIRSQAEGGMSLSSKSPHRTEGGKHPRARTRVHGAACVHVRGIPAKRVDMLERTAMMISCDICTNICYVIGVSLKE